MTSGSLKDFLTTVVNEDRNSPEISTSFDIVVANPGLMGCRNGIKVEQLMVPDQYDTPCNSFEVTDIKKARTDSCQHKSRNQLLVNSDLKYSEVAL